MINYVTGDATEPQGDHEHKIICHVCNDVGGWGSGFVLALNKKWSEPEQVFRMRGAPGKEVLGEGQLVTVEVDEENDNFIYVYNMFGQHLTGRDENGHPCIRYDAVWKALRTLKERLDTHGEENVLHPTIGYYSFHMPRIGCGLAGGNWDIMEKIIEDALEDEDIYVYDLPNVDKHTSVHRFPRRTD